MLRGALPFQNLPTRFRSPRSVLCFDQIKFGIAAPPASSFQSPSFRSSFNNDDEETRTIINTATATHIEGKIQKRLEALHEQLKNIGIDVNDLANAARRSEMTTSTSPIDSNNNKIESKFDERFGPSAIRAYKTYTRVLTSGNQEKIRRILNEDVNVAAARCARQIEFLSKRYRSQKEEWVRHTDIGLNGNTLQTPTINTTNPQPSHPLVPLTIVLDNVRSAYNVGSIFRTADACNCVEVITTGITPHPDGSGSYKVMKSALGAERVVNTRHFGTTKEAVEFLRKERPSFMLVGMETTERSVCYVDVIYPGDMDRLVGVEGEHLKSVLSDLSGTALFLGNEVSGVDTDIMPLLDKLVEIPMFGTKNSLNIAASAPVVMYEILRQWGVLRGK